MHLPSFIIPFLAQQSGGSSSGLTSLLIPVLFIGALWFLIIAPQRKKQKAHEKMLTTLQSGDQIVTNGGIYGTITSVKEDRLVVRIADDTKIELSKNFVSSKLNSGSK